MNSSSDNSGPESPSPDHGPPSTVPRQGRLLGLDYGTHRIGTALSTPDQTIASPLENYTLLSDAADAAFLREQVREYRVVALVVGLPIRSQGEEGAKAREARMFGDWAGRMTGLPVAYADESYSTAAAEDLLRDAGLNRKQRKARLDKLAAQLMLQAFLDRRAAHASDRNSEPSA
jgi:putative Holliday junction resolvase